VLHDHQSGATSGAELLEPFGFGGPVHDGDIHGRQPTKEMFRVRFLVVNARVLGRARTRSVRQEHIR
jgi:hypothetical protein